MIASKSLCHRCTTLTTVTTLTIISVHLNSVHSLNSVNYSISVIGNITVNGPYRNCVAYKSVSGHLALRDDVNKNCLFLGHNIGAVSENY